MTTNVAEPEIIETIQPIIAFDSAYAALRGLFCKKSIVRIPIRGQSHVFNPGAHVDAQNVEVFKETLDFVCTLPEEVRKELKLEQSPDHPTQFSLTKRVSEEHDFFDPGVRLDLRLNQQGVYLAKTRLSLGEQTGLRLYTQKWRGNEQDVRKHIASGVYLGVKFLGIDSYLMQ